jgi:hypothetical protein
MDLEKECNERREHLEDVLADSLSKHLVRNVANMVIQYYDAPKNPLLPFPLTIPEEIPQHWDEWAHKYCIDFSECAFCDGFQCDIDQGSIPIHGFLLYKKRYPYKYAFTYVYRTRLVSLTPENTLALGLTIDIVGNDKKLLTPITALESYSLTPNGRLLCHIGFEEFKNNICPLHTGHIDIAKQKSRVMKHVDHNYNREYYICHTCKAPASFCHLCFSTEGKKCKIKIDKKKYIFCYDKCWRFFVPNKPKKSFVIDNRCKCYGGSGCVMM